MSSKFDELVVVASFYDRPEADLAKSALEAAGIEAIVQADDCGTLRPGMWMGNGVHVVVRQRDADAAREILNTPAKRA
jgi:hypothetical protein